MDSAVGKRGLFLCQIASIFLLERLQGRKSGDARDFNNIEKPTVINSFPPQGKAPKKIQVILIEILGE
jgi:hypothetical protein